MLPADPLVPLVCKLTGGSIDQVPVVVPYPSETTVASRTATVESTPTPFFFVHENLLFQAVDIPEEAAPGDTVYQTVPTVWRHRSEDGAVTMNTLVGVSQVINALRPAALRTLIISSDMHGQQTKGIL